jgi:hypothetical protein
MSERAATYDRNEPMRSALLPLILACSSLASAADPAEGRKLVEQKNCETCHHARRCEAIFARIAGTSFEKLKAQVGSHRINLQLFRTRSTSWLTSTGLLPLQQLALHPSRSRRHSPGWPARIRAWMKRLNRSCYLRLLEGNEIFDRRSHHGAKVHEVSRVARGRAKDR